MKAAYQGHSRKSGVYQFRNLVDGKVYIGSTVEFKRRFTQHRHHLRKGIHHNKHLQYAFQKYGEDHFIFEVLEVVDGDRSVYSQVEQAHLDRYLDNWEQCYNFVQSSVSSPRRVFSKTPEYSKAKLSEALKQSWREDTVRREAASQRMRQLWKDPNHRQYISDKVRTQWDSGALLRQKPEEYKHQISKAKGALITVDGVSKASTQWAAHPKCSVTAQCIRRRLKRGWSPKRAIFLPSLAGVVTEEHRQQISKKNKGRKHTPEARRKMSDKAKGRIPWNKKV